MRKPTSVTVLFLAFAVVGIGLFLWLQPGETVDPSDSRAAADNTRPAVPDARASTAAAASSALSAEARAMLAELLRGLASGDAREREAILAFADAAAMRRFLERAQQAGLTVVSQLDALNAVRVRFNSLDGLQRDLLAHGADYSAIAANNLVGIPQPPAKEQRAAVNQVPFGNDTLAFLGATGDRSNWGRGTTIAILDTGVGADPTFGQGRLRTLDIGLGSAPGSGADDGHGTAIAALAAGFAPDAPGVAPAASLLSIRVTDASGTSDLFTVAKGIVAAVDAGAKIINISLGGYSTGSMLDSAIGYAAQNGAVIVAAAGNDQAAQLAWPAADSRVVSVGAIDKLEQQVSFSNSGEQLQLAAPGYGVQTAWLDNQRVYMDGTSASSPIVAGAIAALISQNPSLTPQQAANLLATTANDGGQPGADSAYGHGIVNLATAMNSSNPAYIDTAVSSHYYDAANGQMEFVIQNRSGRAVAGMSLNVTSGSATFTQTVPSLDPGKTHVATLPVNNASLQAAGSMSFSTQLVNPTGTTDQVPTNNRRTSVLSGK